jgi:hypothetical protein
LYVICCCCRRIGSIDIITSIGGRYEFSKDRLRHGPSLAEVRLLR